MKTKPVILTVDDSPAKRFVLAQILEAAGFSVRAAATGEEALRMTAAEEPDLVLLDVCLPDIDGREVCRRIRGDPRTARIPVLHVTATEKRPADEVRGYESGADGYLLEPVDPEVLVASIRSLLRARRAEQELAAARDELGIQLADLTRLLELAARLAGTMDLNVVLREILASVTQILGAPMGNILLYDQQAGALRPAASIGLSEANLRLIARVEPGTGPCGLAFVEKRPFIVEDVETDPVYAPFLDAAREGGYRAVLSTPLLTLRGEALGTIAAFFAEPKRPSESQRRMTELYARQAAQAIENARLYSEAEEGRRILDALMEHVPEGIVILDSEGKVRTISRCGLELAGQSAADVAGKPYSEMLSNWGLVTGDGVEPLPLDQLASGRAIRSGRPITNQEWQVIRPDQKQLSLLTNAAPIRDEAGRNSGCVITYRDITERKTFELRLRETQRLESIGVLAGGIAHDFNNLLTSIMGGTSLVLDMLENGHPAAEMLQDVMCSGERAAHLTSQLLAYSGRGRFVVRRLNLREAVSQISTLLRNSVPVHIDLRFELDGNLPAIQADAKQFQQLLLNLIMNAAEAIGENRGTIVVRAGTGQVESDDADLVGELKSGAYVYLEVQDTGGGMTPEVRSRIFEPFFTTKFLGRGLGLPAALGILRGHRGGFQVHSVPGQGSVFRALFPMAVEAPPARETILLVDDEEMVVRVGKMALERAGYNVLVAQSGAGALDIFKAHNEAIAAVVLDLKMPEMSGAELLERLLVLRPDLRVLVATAYDEEEALRQTSRGATGFLHKPYTAAAFTRKVQEILRT